MAEGERQPATGLVVYRQRVEKELGQQVEVVVVGSYARGTQTPESDVDVVVVVPKLTPQIIDKLLEIAWEVGFENGLVISVIPVGRDELEVLSESPFWQTVEREGVKI